MCRGAGMVRTGSSSGLTCLSRVSLRYFNIGELWCRGMTLSLPDESCLVDCNLKSWVVQRERVEGAGTRRTLSYLLR